MADPLHLRNKEKYVAEGIMRFAQALIHQHHADATTVMTYLAREIKQNLNLIEVNDTNRNR